MDRCSYQQKEGQTAPFPSWPSTGIASPENHSADAASLGALTGGRDDMVAVLVKSVSEHVDVMMARKAQDMELKGKQVIETAWQRQKAIASDLSEQLKRFKEQQEQLQAQNKELFTLLHLVASCIPGASEVVAAQAKQPPQQKSQTTFPPGISGSQEAAAVEPPRLSRSASSASSKSAHSSPLAGPHAAPAATKQGLGEAKKQMSSAAKPFELSKALDDTVSTPTTGLLEAALEAHYAENGEASPVLGMEDFYNQAMQASMAASWDSLAAASAAAASLQASDPSAANCYWNQDPADIWSPSNLVLPEIPMFPFPLPPFPTSPFQGAAPATAQAVPPTTSVAGNTCRQTVSLSLAEALTPAETTVDSTAASAKAVPPPGLRTPLSLAASLDLGVASEESQPALAGFCLTHTMNQKQVYTI